MMALNLSDYVIAKHPDDEWIDTIALCNAQEQALLRLVVYPRYKMSGLSGDEWRFSYGWQCTPEMATRMHGDLASSADSNWLSFDTGYGSITGACAGLFPGLYRSQPDIQQHLIALVTFSRKGRILYGSSYDGTALPLLLCAGHLPWAWIQACDEPLGTEESWRDMQRLCTQPGCADLAVSTYQLHKRYRKDGSDYEAMEYSGTLASGKAPMIRRFCPRHLRRGDCGRDDADSNYRVLDGPGPNDAHGYQDYISHAQTIQL